MRGRIPKQSSNKYNLEPSLEFEDSYCQSSSCPNNNMIKLGTAVRKKRMIFCSEECLTEVEKKILID